MILRAEGCAKIDDKFYFMSMDMNVFYSIREADGEITYEGSIPGEEIGLLRAAKIISYNRTLIFIPLNAKCVSFYDIDSKSWNQVSVKPMAGFKKDKFFSAHIYDNKLILIGSVYPAIMLINLEDYTEMYISEMYKERLDDFQKKRDCFVRSDTVLVDNRLYFVSCVSNHVGIVDLETLSWEWVEIDEKEGSFSGIAWDGNVFWISSRRKGNIIKWSPKSNKTEKIKLSPGKQNFLGVIYDGIHVIFPGMRQDETLVFKASGNEKVNNAFTVWKKDYIFFINNGNENYAMTREGKFEVYSVQGLFERMKEYSVSTQKKEFLQKIFNSMEPLQESAYVTLRDYIKAIEL